MGILLTDKVRIEQTSKKRIFKLLDNELYQDDDGYIYIVPRYFQTDNYSIPLWVAPLGGSPVEFNLLPSHLHDFACDTHSMVYVNLTAEEIVEKGFLRFSKSRKLWVCEDIPKEFLKIKPFSKVQANNLLYRAMKNTQVPFIDRFKVRLGVCANLNWYLTDWTKRVLQVDLDNFYNEDYWDKHIPI